jgi:hypothetical protein
MTMKHRWVILVLLGKMSITGCGKSTESGDEKGGSASANCEEPQNPYPEGGGHYAGYKWAEEKGSGECNGSSQSFNEGCEEYETQEAEYQECESKK